MHKCTYNHSENVYSAPSRLLLRRAPDPRRFHGLEITCSRQMLALVDKIGRHLPSELRSLPRDLSSSFYKLLKTLLFGRAWAGSASE